MFQAWLKIKRLSYITINVTCLICSIIFSPLFDITGFISIFWVSGVGLLRIKHNYASQIFSKCDDYRRNLRYQPMTNEDILSVTASFQYVTHSIKVFSRLLLFLWFFQLHINAMKSLNGKVPWWLFLPTSVE